MKVLVTRKISHGHFLFDEKGEKKMNADGSGIPLTDTVTLTPTVDGPPQVYDTEKDEPFASKLSKADVANLVANGSLKELTAPPGPPVAPPRYVTAEEVVRIVADEFAKLTAPKQPETPKGVKA